MKSLIFITYILYNISTDLSIHKANKTPATQKVTGVIMQLSDHSVSAEYHISKVNNVCANKHSALPTLKLELGCGKYKSHKSDHDRERSVDDRLHTNGDWENEAGKAEDEDDIEDCIKEYGHYDSIRDLVNSGVTWFSYFSDEAIKKIEDILGVYSK